MASAKRISVAGSQFSQDTAYSASAVYSLTGTEDGSGGALRMAYNSCSSAGAQEGITRMSTTGRGVAASADGGNPFFVCAWPLVDRASFGSEVWRSSCCF